MEIHLHGAGNESAEIIEVDPTLTIGTLIEERRSKGLVILAVSVQDAEEDLGVEVTIGEVGAHRLHLHRCRADAVSVEYNGAAKTRDFRPNQRVRRVKEWAVEAFGITPRDAADLVLAYGNPLQKINEGLHIGDLRFTDCRVALSLVPINHFNG